MASRNIEIERFARKASGYRAAISEFPHARELELAGVVAIVKGICEGKGWHTEAVRVLDLMAGTGILSTRLKLAGFSNVVAIELCDEMHAVPVERSSIDWIAAADLEEGLDRCKSRKPQIIVSLASFHHLLTYTGSTVDRLASVAGQYDVLCRAVECLSPDGVLVIVDLADDGFFAVARDDLPMAITVCPVLPGEDQALAEELQKCKSTSQYLSVIDKWRKDEVDNPSLRWFREVVDPGTVIGHKDMALSSEFSRICERTYIVRTSSLRCPWVFASREDVVRFCTQKFGFLVDRSPAEVRTEELSEQLDKVLKVKKTAQGLWALDWRLGVMVVSRADGKHKPVADDQVLLGILIALIGLLSARMVLIAWAPALFISTTATLTRITWVFGGMLLAKLLQVMLERRWRQWF